jgi:hypothetical protein
MPLVILSIFTPALGGFSQSVVYESEGGGILDGAVVVPKTEMSRAGAEARARRFLSQHGRTHSLMRLTIASDRAELQRSIVNPVRSASDDAFLAAARQAGLPKNGIARLIALRGAALFSFRDSDGLWQKLLAGSSNPTILREGKDTYELLHFRLTRNAAALDDPDYLLDVYLKASDKLSSSGGVAITKRLQGLFQPSRRKINVFSIHIRPSVWFFSEQYPLVFPYVESFAVPDVFTFTSSSWLNCSYFPRRSSTGFSCSGSRFLP